MEGNEEQLNGWRTKPLYPVSLVAKLAGVSHATVRRWLYGDPSPGHQMRPVFERRSRPDRGEAQAEVSFLQLAEIVVVSRFRSRRVTLERLRRAHKFARQRFNLEYPFARLSLKTDGVHVLLAFEDSEPGASLLSLDEYGQLTLPGDVIEVLDTFDFEQDLAARWFPAGRRVPIVIDPRFGAGVPTVPQRRLTVATIYKRWTAGQSIKFIAEDFHLKPSVVEEVLRFAEKYAA